MSSSRLSVVIVNFNSAEFVVDCVESLAVSEVERIVIVDSASTRAGESSCLLALEEGDDRIKLVQLEENVGFGAAANLGVSRVLEGDSVYCWILNPDTVVDQSAIQHLLMSISNDRLEILSPTIVTGSRDHPTIWFDGGEVALASGETTMRCTSPTDFAAETVPFVPGTAMFFRCDTWRALGGFREDLFMYWEDAELCLRASERCVNVRVVAEARIWHHVGGSSGSEAKGPLWHFYMNRNRILVCASFGASVIGLLWGPGMRQSLRLVKIALADRSRAPLSLSRAFSGTVDGIRSVRALRAFGARAV